MRRREGEKEVLVSERNLIPPELEPYRPFSEDRKTALPRWIRRVQIASIAVKIGCQSHHADRIAFCASEVSAPEFSCGRTHHSHPGCSFRVCC